MRDLRLPTCATVLVEISGTTVTAPLSTPATCPICARPMLTTANTCAACAPVVFR